MVHSLWGRSKPVYLQKFPDRQLCEHLEEVLVPREEIITQDITVLTQKENKRVFYNCISQHNQTRKVIRSEQSFREDNSVHQEAKSKKWKCKLCGEQQSVIKVFGRGSGKDCRQHVQKLNMLRGERDHQRQHSLLTVSPNQQEHDICCQTQEPSTQNHEQQVSKWEQYLSSPTELGSGKDASSDEEEQFGHPAIYKSRMKKKGIGHRKKPRFDVHDFVDMETETGSNTQGQAFSSNHFHQTYTNHNLYPAKMDPGNFTQVSFERLDYGTSTKTNKRKHWAEKAPSSSSATHHSTKSKWSVYLQEESVPEEEYTKENNESSDFGNCLLDEEVAGSRNGGKRLSVLKSVQRKELSPMNSMGEAVNSVIYHHSLRHHSQVARQDMHSSKEIKSTGSTLDESSKTLPDTDSQNPITGHRSLALSLFSVGDDTLENDDIDF